MNTNINARDYLEKCGIKPSLQRIAIVEYLMDDTIHTADDMEKYFGLVPLTTIPDSDQVIDLDEEQHRRRGRKRGRKK